MSFQAQNYKISWQLLVETFEHKNLLGFIHLKEIFRIDTISPPSASLHRNLNNKVSEHLNLKELKVTN